MFRHYVKAFYEHSGVLSWWMAGATFGLWTVGDEDKLFDYQVWAIAGWLVSCVPIAFLVRRRVKREREE